MVPNVFFGLLMFFAGMHNAAKVGLYTTLYAADRSVASHHYRIATIEFQSVESQDKGRIAILLHDVSTMEIAQYQRDVLRLYGPILKRLTNSQGG